MDGSFSYLRNRDAHRLIEEAMRNERDDPGEEFQRATLLVTRAPSQLQRPMLERWSDDSVGVVTPPTKNPIDTEEYDIGAPLPKRQKATTGSRSPSPLSPPTVVRQLAMLRHTFLDDEEEKPVSPIPPTRGGTVGKTKRTYSPPPESKDSSSE